MLGSFIRYTFRGVTFIINQSNKSIYVVYGTVANLNEDLEIKLEDSTIKVNSAEVVTYDNFVAAVQTVAKHDSEMVEFGYSLAERLMKDFAMHCEQNDVVVENITDAQLNAAREMNYLPFRRDFKSLMLDVIDSNKIGVIEGKNYYYAMRHVQDKVYSVLFGKYAKEIREIINGNQTYQAATITAGIEFIKIVGEVFKLATEKLFLEYAEIREFSEIIDIVEASAFSVATRKGKQISALKASVRINLG
jgi:hypothetical protein